VLTGARQVLVIGSVALRRRMLVSLEINNKDKAYEWFLAWMAGQTSSAANSSSLLGRSVRSHQLSVETTFEQRKNGSSSVLFKLVAGPGTHWFRYQGAWMQVSSQRDSLWCALEKDDANSVCNLSVRSNESARRVRCRSCPGPLGKR
jgi:mitochondrial chaperone BCS1